MSLSSIPRILREAVFTRDEGRCRYCRLAQHGSGGTFHIDHIVPRSRGGATVLENMALLCPSCSLRKANKTIGADPVTQRQEQLFDPLRQSWVDHFRLEEDGACVGLSAIGRATVQALKMNDPIPRIARACQKKLGLL